MKAICGNCGQIFVAPDEYRGKDVKCPLCKVVVAVNELPEEKNTFSGSGLNRTVWISVVISIFATSIVWFVAYNKIAQDNKSIKERLSSAYSKIAQLEDTVNTFTATQTKNLHQRYPKLKKCNINEEIYVHDRYVQSIFVGRDICRILIHD